MARLTFKIPMKIGTQTGNLYDAGANRNSLVAREMVFDDATTNLGSNNIIIVNNNNDAAYRFAPVDDLSDSTNRTWSSDKINNELQAVLTGGIANGTVTSSTLRWDGADWVEVTTFKVDASGNLDTTGGTITNSIGNLTLNAKSTSNIILSQDTTANETLKVLGVSSLDGSVTTSSGNLTFNPGGSLVTTKDMSMSGGARSITSTGGNLTIDASATGNIIVGSSASYITLSKDTTLTTGNVTTANTNLTLNPSGTGIIYLSKDTTSLTGIFRTAANIALTLAPQGTGGVAVAPVGSGTFMVTPDATFTGNVYINGGTLATRGGALAISPVTNLTLSPTGSLFVSNDMTFSAAAARRIVNTGGSLTIDASTGGGITMAKDTTFAGDIYLNGNDLSSTGAINIGTNANGAIALSANGTGNVTVASGTGKFIVTPDSTFNGSVYIKGGTLGTWGGALSIAPTTDLTLNPTGVLYAAKDMTMTGGARFIKATAGDLTLDASATGGHVFLAKDTTVTGAFQGSSTGKFFSNMDIDGTVSMGSSGIVVTNGVGNVLAAAIQPGSEYQLLQIAAGATTFSVASILDCGTF